MKVTDLKEKQVVHCKTHEEKQIYNEVVITPEELKAELKKYVLKGRNVYLHVTREAPAAKIYGQPNADGTGMVLAGYLKRKESLKKWVERKLRMKKVIEKRVEVQMKSSRND